MYSDIPEYEQKLVRLQEELRVKVRLAEENDGKLEDPTKCRRWRELGGEDLDDEQLSAKINVHIQRLSKNKEMMLDREISLEEITVFDAIKSYPAIRKLNDHKRKASKITCSMMAIVSELSMYQATALKLEKENEQQEGLLKLAHVFVIDGKPPSEKALKTTVSRETWQL